MEKDGQALRILICDDDPQDRKLIRTYLNTIESQKIVAVETGETAEIQQAIDSGELDIVLMDLNMPYKSGMDWLKEIVDLELAPVVILTGYGDEETAVRSLQRGAVGYLPKRKLSAESLAETIDEAIRQWRRLLLIRGNLDQMDRLVNIDSVTGELIRNKFLKTLRQTIGQDTMEALTKIVEFRDPYTAAHQQRVAQLACAISKNLPLPEEQTTGVHLAGLVHDIGKIGIPAEILCNPNQLTEAEFKIIKTHPTTGYEVLKSINLPWPIADIIHQHHERIDGSGYPLNLKGKDILLEARIIAVADVIEAIASRRPYRPSLGLEYALKEITKNKGRLYDTEVVNTCMKIFRELGFEFLSDIDRPPSAQLLATTSVAE